MKYGMSIIVRGDSANPETFDRMADEAEIIGLGTNHGDGKRHRQLGHLGP